MTEKKALAGASPSQTSIFGGLLSRLKHASAEVILMIRAEAFAKGGDSDEQF
jgi:hypothetical protein